MQSSKYLFTLIGLLALIFTNSRSCHNAKMLSNISMAYCFISTKYSVNVKAETSINTNKYRLNSCLSKMRFITL